MIHRYLRLFLLLSAFAPSFLSAQVPTGTEFIVPLPSVLTVEEWNRNAAGFYVEVLCSQTTNVTARLGNGALVGTRIVFRSNRATFGPPYLTIRDVMPNPDELLSERPEKRCVVITTDRPVSVQGVLDTSYRTEAYSLLPTSAYDTLHTVVTYAGRAQGSDRNGFTVMAREDGTVVSITPTVATLAGHAAGVEYSVILNRYDIYEVKSASVNAGPGTDLTGTRVRSTKPIGLLGFAVSNVPFDSNRSFRSSKPMIAPIPGHHLAGRSFFLHPFYRRLPSFRVGPPDSTTWSRIVPIADGTTISIDGLPVTTLQRGQPFDLPVGRPTIVTTNRDAIVMMMAASSDLTLRDTLVGPQGNESAVIAYGDPMMLWLPPQSSWKRWLHVGNLVIGPRTARAGGPQNRDVGYYPWQHVVAVVAPLAGSDGVTLDGFPIAFSDTFPDRQHVLARIRVNGTRHEIGSDVPVGATAYGFALNDSYGLTSGHMPVATGLAPGALFAATCSTRIDTGFVLRNVGDGPLRIDSITVTGAAATRLAPVTLPQQISPDDSFRIVLRIPLPLPDTTRAIVRVYTNSRPGDGVFTVPLTIRRDSARLDVTPLLDFGVVPAGTSSIDSFLVLRNDGTTPILIDTAALIGSGFEIVDRGTGEIAPGATDTIGVRFLPVLGLPREATLRILGGPCLEPREVILRGFQGEGAILLATTGMELTTDRCAPSMVDSVVQIRAVGSEPLTIDSVRVVGPDAALFDVTLPSFPVTLPPPDTLLVPVSWNPLRSGTTTATIEIFSNAANAPLHRVNLRGRRDSVALRTEIDTLQLPTILICGEEDTTSSSGFIRLVNDGSVSDTVRATIEGASGFVVDSAAVVVLPSAVQQIEVRYTGRDTVARGIIRFVSSPCGLVREVYLLAQRRIALLDAPAAFDLDTLWSCDAPDTIEIPVVNRGTITDSLLSAATGDPIELALLDDFPTVVPPGETALLRLRIAGRRAGTLRDTISILRAACTEPLRIAMTGTVATAAFAGSLDTLRFGSTLVGDSAERSIFLHNRGSTSREVTTATLPAGVTIVSPTLPLTLAAGDSIAVVMRFAPSTNDSLDAEVFFAAGAPCASTIMIRLLGRGASLAPEITRVTLELPDTTTAIDQGLLLPLRLRSSNGIAAIDSLDVVLSWRRSVLARTGNVVAVSAGGAAIVSEGDRGERRVVTVRLRSPFPASGTLALLPTLVLLGDTDRTTLTIDSVEAAGADSVIVERIDGALTIDGICMIDGNRYIRLRGISLRNIRPNPASSEVTVELLSAEERMVDLWLVDGTGEPVRAGHRETIASGMTAITVQIGDLPSGVYGLVVRSGDHVERGRVVVVR